MLLGSVTVYFNFKFGFIIGFEATVKGSVMRRIVEPVVVENPDISEERLGNRIYEELQKSRNAPSVSHEESKDYKYWQVTGIKGFAAFSKKFKCIDISHENNKLYISALIRDSDGGYSEPDENEIIKVSSSISAEELGSIVSKMLRGQPAPKIEENCSFVTLEDTEVSFKRPSDIFVDIGDGNTDAYQVYVGEANEKNCIIFLIDNMYSEFKEDVIRRKWEQIYGKMSKFIYSNTKDGMLRYKIEGVTKDKYIVSNIYQNGKGMLEVVFELDIVNTTEDVKGLINQDFQNIINSIKINNIED